MCWCVLDGQEVSDAELMRRYRLLYPKPTKYQEASARLMAAELAAGGGGGGGDSSALAGADG